MQQYSRPASLEDFKTLISSLNKNQVDYLLIGGYALFAHGYRSENRYTVFQCLAHTLNWPASRWHVLDAACLFGEGS